MNSIRSTNIRLYVPVEVHTPVWRGSLKLHYIHLSLLLSEVRNESIQPLKLTCLSTNANIWQQLIDQEIPKCFAVFFSKTSHKPFICDDRRSNNCSLSITSLPDLMWPVGVKLSVSSSNAARIRNLAQSKETPSTTFVSRGFLRVL